ncbi:MAG TPA: alkaline phosphatase PhoX [Microlunatus sp.]
MDRSIARRTLLGGTAAVGLGVAFAGSLEAFGRPEPQVPGGTTGYGPLVADPLGVVSLPAGFSYVEVARSGTPTEAGGPPYPSDPDGMGVFAGPAGGSILVSNHEYGGSETFRLRADPSLTYDSGSFGGTSTLAVDADGKRLSRYASLAGSENNCAGGITPWGTWLTCEETERKKDTVIGSGANRRVLQKDHGYVFEVHPIDPAANQNPVPLRFLGRYSHEAVAVDPVSSAIYLTEDAVTPNGLYYRWLPPSGFQPGVGALRKLAEENGGDTAGRLQAMSCSQGRRHIVDLSEATRVGTRYGVRWIDVPDRQAVDTSTRLQAFTEPITRSRKLEGAWWGNGGAYFVSSFARPEALGDGSLNAHDGQVWFYDPDSRTITLKTLFGLNPQDPEQDGTWDGPDTITVSPHGGLILAEDGGGQNHLIGVSRRGQLYALARNEHREPNQPAPAGEFCGPAFSADGRVLFANIQAPTFGVTLAITGPWRRG